MVRNVYTWFKEYTNVAPPIILRLPDVRARTGLSRSTIYKRVAKNQFPKPISLGGRAVGWIEQEINEWVELQIKLSRNPIPGLEYVG